MIDHLDTVLRELLRSQVPSLPPPPGMGEEPIPATDEQVRFQPPDEDWRMSYIPNLSVNGDPANAFNVYLVDLRENVRLRSNERICHTEDGIVLSEPAPGRVDCHYLISAWDPATPGPDSEPTLDEHRLLYDVLAVLRQCQPLVPRQVFDPDPLPPGFPDVLADAELPIEAVPAEGFPKLAEFWGTMGPSHRWKPVVYLIVTLPVFAETDIAGPMVTTLRTDYRRRNLAESAEARIQIGGHLFDATAPAPADPQPVTGAWVRLETPGGDPLQTTETDAAGRFTFADLRAGSYQLRARATGLGEITREIDVPSPSGEYDLSFA